MNIDKDGKLDIPSRWTFRIMNEFGFDLEAMADEIIDLRQHIEVKDKEITERDEEVDKLYKLL